MPFDISPELARELDELRTVVDTYSITRGDFTLASGDKSSFYCDGKKTTLSPRGALLVGRTLFALLDQLGAEAVGGLAMGADFITTAVALVSEQAGRPIHGFAVRKASKGHGTQQRIECAYHPEGELLRAGRKVAVVEDTITRGGSIQQAIDEVRATGAEIVAAAAIVDRGAGGGEKLLAQGLPFFSLLKADAEGRLSVAL